MQLLCIGPILFPCGLKMFHCSSSVASAMQEQHLMNASAFIPVECQDDEQQMYEISHPR